MTRVRELAMVMVAAVLAGAGPAEARDPDLISLGLGWYDEDVVNPGFGPWNVSDDDPKDGAVDFRLEYRFGLSLLPFIEPWARLRPFAGTEWTSDGALFGHAGLLLDVPIGPFFITPSAGVSVNNRGGKDLGSALVFRTMIEIGYEFENRSRLAVQYSHISNAGVSETNPGSNLIGAYYHLPAAWLLGDSTN